MPKFAYLDFNPIVTAYLLQWHSIHFKISLDISLLEPLLSFMFIITYGDLKYIQKFFDTFFKRCSLIIKCELELATHL